MFKSIKNSFKNFSLLQKIVLFASIFVLIGALIFLVWPHIYSVSYYVSQPEENSIKYSVSNPKLLLDKDVRLSNLSQLELQEKTKDLKISSQKPSGNRLVIPKIGVDSSILEGDNLDVLKRDEGVWREPFTGTPSIESNMVIAGHRFQYLPPNTNTFYNLNRLKTGDKIIVYWKENNEIKDYVYEIYQTMLVQPTDTFVRDFDPSKQKEITLYTCGPEVGQNEKRIVVKAQLVT